MRLRTVPELALAAATSLALLAPAPLLAGVPFTADQADRGQGAYATHCALCHGAELVSTDAEAPTLTGFTFNLRLAGKTLAEESTIIHETMPPGGGPLEMQMVYDLLAFILSRNGAAPGADELTADSDLSIRIDRAP